MKLLSLSGFVPEQIYDTVRFTGYQGERNIQHYCGYANDFISQVLNDKSLDGAVFPKSCDSSRIIPSYLDGTNKFFYQFLVPSHNSEDAVRFFAKQIEDYKHAIERKIGEEIDDIEERIHIINKRNKAVSEAYMELEECSYKMYLEMIHANLNKPLREQTIEILSCGKTYETRKRIFLVGSFLHYTEVADVLEKNGLKIVGDNLPESGRLRRMFTDETGGNIYETIADSILSHKLSPTQNNFEKIIQTDLKEIETKKVDAVVFATQNYCEAYDFLYVPYRKELEKRGIPSVKISFTNHGGANNLSLIVEAFAESV